MKYTTLVWTVGIIAAAGALAFALVSGHLISNKLKKKFDAIFVQAIGDAPMTRQRFYKKDYASGIIDDRFVIATLIPQQIGDAGTPIVSPKKMVSYNADILIDIKIRGAAKHGSIYTAVLAQHAQKSTRDLTGWQNPEEGFFVHHLPKNSMEESLAAFGLLQADTKQALLELAQKYNGVSLSPAGYLVFMIGENNAQTLTNQRPDAFYEPSIQIRIPTGSSIQDHVRACEKALELLERDLK